MSQVELKKFELTQAECNQIEMALVAYKAIFKNESMPCVDNLIKRFMIV